MFVLNRVNNLDRYKDSKKKYWIKNKIVEKNCLVLFL